MTTPTTTGEQLVSDADHVQLERLALELNWRVDTRTAETVPELFTEDGVLNTLGEPVVGHDALRAWGRVVDSDASPVAGVHHVLTNLRFVADGPDRAIGTLYVTAYLPGAPRGQDTLPFAMGQCTDRYVRTPGGWKIESRVFQPFFLRDNDA